MKRILAIAQRELSAYFATAMGWISLSGFVALTGLIFALIITASFMQGLQMSYGGALNVNEHVVPDLFGTIAVFLLFLTPAISMRLFAEDRKQHSIELLLSSPVSSLEIVLGKYLGAIGFLLILLIGTLHCVAIMFWISTPDPMILITNYIGVFLMGAAFLSLGMLTSACTKSQLIALVLSFGALLGLWFFTSLGGILEGSTGEIISYFSVLSHMEQMTKGLLHTKDVVYYLTFSAFFVFATHQRVEAMRWQ